MKKKQFKADKWLKYKIFFIVASLFGFGYLLFHSYYTYIDNTKEEDLPIIRAPTNIVSKPEDPGGMIIPDKDKDIYKQMSGKKKTDEKIKTAGLDENGLSKSKALDLINNQLKKWKIVEGGEESKKQIYYLRVAKLVSNDVTDKALIMLQNQYADLKGLSGKLYEEKHSDGSIGYYLHVGPITQLSTAENLCSNLIREGKSCKVFSDNK